MSAKPVSSRIAATGSSELRLTHCSYTRFRRPSTGTLLQNHPSLSINGEDPVGPFCRSMRGVLEGCRNLRIMCRNHLSS